MPAIKKVAGPDRDAGERGPAAAPKASMPPQALGKTMTSRDFNQDTGRAKKDATKAPVFITDRGRPTYVLLSYDAFQRLTGGRRSLAEALSRPGLSEIELDAHLPRFGDMPDPPDLS